MTEYGNTIEPGIVTNVSSENAVSTSGGSPTDVGLVGQADLANGDANANEVYQLTSTPTARAKFGEDSPLTKAVNDALAEGAYPVYAVAADSTSVTSEDLSGLSSSSGTLSNGPSSEVAGDTSFTINGTSMTTVVTYDDPATTTPGAGEVYLNPSTQEFEVDDSASVGNAGDEVDYDYYDYDTALTAMADDAGSVIDFLVPLSEASAVRTSAETTAETMADEYDFALTIVGAGPHISNFTDYTAPADNSRVQAVYPPRNADGESTLASYAGIRASIGITGTPINKRMTTQGDLGESLKLGERGSLIDGRVVPFAQENGGARIADDVNTVSDENTDEANIRFGFSRLVVDSVLGTVRNNEQPFIGRLNAYPVRKAFEGLVRQELRPLTRSNAIIDYEVSVFKGDATTARLELSVDTAEPIRFIENEVSIGNSA